MTYLALAILVQLLCFQYGVSQLVIANRSVTTRQEEAIAGAQGVVDTDIAGVVESGYLGAIGNFAKSITEIANSGSRTIAVGDTTVQDSDLTANYYIYDNDATSNQNKAVSGTQVALINVQDSALNKNTISRDNKASIVGAETGNDYTAIAGAQSLFSSVIGSTIQLNESARTNTASNNFNGKAVAGVDQAFGAITNTYLVQSNAAEDNFAVAGDGRAVSGIQSGAREVADSTIVNFGSATNNQAKSINGNAVAGIENNFRTLNGTFPGGSATVVLATNATGNTASAVDGKAIAGVATNVKEMQRSTLVQIAESEDNKAVTFGEGDTPKQSVAGVSVVINDLKQSTVALNLTSDGNQAFNYHQDPRNASDAIAGSQVVIGSVDRGVVDVISRSTNNYAMAKYGDAIAGNQLDVLDSTQDAIIAVDLQAYNNSAMADNGNAVIENSVNIRGDADTIPSGL